MLYLEALVIIGVPAFFVGAATAWAVGTAKPTKSPGIIAQMRDAEDLEEVHGMLTATIQGYEFILRKANEQVPEHIAETLTAMKEWDGRNLIGLYSPSQDQHGGIEISRVARATTCLQRAVVDMEAALTPASESNLFSAFNGSKRLMDSTRQHFEGRAIELAHMLGLQAANSTFDMQLSAA